MFDLYILIILIRHEFQGNASGLQLPFKQNDGFTLQPST